MATRSLSFDKASGEIDHSTAAYWREHYDLDAILQRNWPTLRPKLRGKIHLYVGSDDTYMLNDAVYLMEDFLKTTGTTPGSVAYEGEVLYGPRAEHCWNGDPTLPNAYSRLQLQHNVPAQDHGAHREDRTRRSRSDQLALLVSESYPPKKGSNAPKIKCFAPSRGKPAIMTALPANRTRTRLTQKAQKTGCSRFVLRSFSHPG